MAMRCIETADGYYFESDSSRYDLAGAILAGASESGLVGAAIYPLDGLVDEDTLQEYPFEMVGYYFEPYFMVAGSNWLTRAEFKRIQAAGIADSINPDM